MQEKVYSTFPPVPQSVNFSGEWGAKNRPVSRTCTHNSHSTETKQFTVQSSLAKCGKAEDDEKDHLELAFQLLNHHDDYLRRQLGRDC